MFFQIEKIILWPKNENNSPRIIEFALNKVNLITGSSKTGKSSIIPIVDYCLGASKCSIPVNTIRDSTAWYGVQIKTGKSRLLIARKDPENQQSTKNSYFFESEEIDVPRFITKHNINIDDVKIKLNEIVGVSNINFDFSDSGRPDKMRTSLRDLIAFNYQPQNIVANPNALFYKTDSFEHKSKLVTIFPYVLGALNNRDLENIHRLKAKEEEFGKIERKYRKMKKQNEDWISLAKAYVEKSVELGLINIRRNINEIEPERLINLLKIVASKEIDYSPSDKGIKYSAEKEINLLKGSKRISDELNKLKNRLVNLNSIRDATRNHSDLSKIKRERLYFSKWLLENSDQEKSILSNKNEIKTLILEPLAKAFKDIEPEFNIPERVATSLSKESLFIENEITRLSSELKDIKEQIRIHKGDKSKIGYDAFSMGKFVGKVQSAVKLFSIESHESELELEYLRLKEELSSIRSLTATKDFSLRTELQLKRVDKLATDWLPMLDTENPNAPISLSSKELTVKINNRGREDYLWEIGSGANWVSYHIAVTLALHQHFSELPHSPVPNYIIYDQPSQVYFPSKSIHREGSYITDGEIYSDNDEDIVQVRKLFKVFNDAIDKTKGNLQIIVLEHAPSDLVNDLKNGHLVEEWRGGLKLVPVDWI